jgi:hypothetical protein
VAQVVEAADRIDASLGLCRPPMLASEDPESILPPRIFGNKIGLSDAGSRSSASSAFACSGTARVLSRVFVCLSRPFA